MQTTVKQVVAVLQNDSALQTLLSGTSTNKKIFPSIPNQFESLPCIVYSVIGAGFRSIPFGEEDITLQLNLLSKTSKQNIEDISTRVNTLLNYYNNDFNNIVYMKKVGEVDENETDRQLWQKALRYQIWTLN